jgi:quercetin dioxygenase-like cupin family protein
MEQRSIPEVFAFAQDAGGERHALGADSADFINFKLLTRDSGGALFIIENVLHTKGGGAPPHVHPDQDEWFYAVEGEFAFEIGGTRAQLNCGDCVLGPRGVPHAWAFRRGKVGRLLIAFTPAGKMEAFFREITKPSSASFMDPAVWRAHGMELLGPPLDV